MSDYEISNFCTSSVEEVSLMCRKQTWTIAEFTSPKELHKYALDPEVFWRRQGYGNGQTY